jgi:hypothetical protein
MGISASILPPVTMNATEFCSLIQYFTNESRSSSFSTWFTRIEKGLFTQALPDIFSSAGSVAIRTVRLNERSKTGMITELTDLLDQWRRLTGYLVCENAHVSLCSSLKPRLLVCLPNHWNQAG